MCPYHQKSLAALVIQLNDIVGGIERLLATTCGQRWPKVLMISAVCGRAPPEELAPNEPLNTAAAPCVDHELLSVTKIRGLS